MLPVIQNGDVRNTQHTQNVVAHVLLCQFFVTILGEDKFNFAETSLTFFGCPAKIFHPAVSGHLRMLAPSMFKYHIRH